MKRRPVNHLRPVLRVGGIRTGEEHCGIKYYFAKVRRVADTVMTEADAPGLCRVELALEVEVISMVHAQLLSLVSEEHRSAQRKGPACLLRVGGVR